MEPSIFTKIINREIPAEIVYEDDQVIAILDIFPARAGHTLVIPKREAKNLTENTPDELLHIFQVVQKVSKAVLDLEGITGVNVVSNINESAGQTVFHTHIHIIPRTGEENYVSWDVNKYENDEALKEMADLLRDKLIAPVPYKDLHPGNPIPKK